MESSGGFFEIALQLYFCLMDVDSALFEGVMNAAADVQRGLSCLLTVL